MECCFLQKIYANLMHVWLPYEIMGGCHRLHKQSLTTRDLARSDTFAVHVFAGGLINGRVLPNMGFVPRLFADSTVPHDPTIVANMYTHIVCVFLQALDASLHTECLLFSLSVQLLDLSYS